MVLVDHFEVQYIPIVLVVFEKCLFEKYPCKMMETVINYALIQVTQILSVKMFAIIYQVYDIKIVCMQRKEHLKFLINLKIQNRVSFAKSHQGGI